MPGLEKVYSDLDEVRRMEESRKRGYSKKKGVTIQTAPERNDKTKFIYSGLCAKKDNKVVQMFPDFESLGKLESKVRKILEKPLNKRQLNGVEYFKISEL